MCAYGSTKRPYGRSRDFRLTPRECAVVLACRAHPEIRASLESYLRFLYPEIRLPGPADNLIDLTAYLPGAEK